MEFYTKVVGVTFEGRQRYVRQTREGERLKLERDRYNIHDRNAIKVINSSGNVIGFISKELAAKMASHIDSGAMYTATVSAITGLKNGENLGVNILVKMHDRFTAGLSTYNFEDYEEPWTVSDWIDYYGEEPNLDGDFSNESYD